MTTDELDRRLRAADPAAELDFDPDSPVAARLLAKARKGRVGAPAVPRRGRTLVAIVVAVMIASTGALATAVFRPDPADVATLLQDAEQAAQQHLPGWRPELVAEAVECHYENGERASTYVSEFDLDQPLTVELIAAECTSGNDLVRRLPEAPTSTTMCALAISPQAYDQRLDDGEDLVVLAGDLSQAVAVVPVVLGWDTACEQATVDTWPPGTLGPLLDGHIAEINVVREVEIGLRAIAMDRCLSRDEAIELGLQAADRLAGEWPLIADERVETDCYQVWVDAWRLLRLEGR